MNYLNNLVFSLAFLILSPSAYASVSKNNCALYFTEVVSFPTSVNSSHFEWKAIEELRPTAGSPMLVRTEKMSRIAEHLLPDHSTDSLWRWDVVKFNPFKHLNALQKNNKQNHTWDCAPQDFCNGMVES